MPRRGDKLKRKVGGRGEAVRGLGAAEEGRHSGTRQLAGGDGARLPLFTLREGEEGIQRIREAFQRIDGQSNDEEVMCARAISLGVEMSGVRVTGKGFG